MGGRFCNQCGTEVTGDGRFCNQCGAAVKGAAPAAGAPRKGPRRSGKEPVGAAAETNNLPWWFAGVAMFALIVVVGWNMVQPAGPVAPGGGGAMPAGGAAPGGAASPDISQMSPRQRADVLYGRIMSAAEAGDSTEAQFFMPMAVQAYEMAEPLDLDGIFHLSLLHRTAGDYESALATAQRILEAEPNHILGLRAAADAARGMGNDDEAAAFYQRLLDNYATEETRGLVEYQGHANLLPQARSDAEAFLAGR